jgi:hypothetical protein
LEVFGLDQPQPFRTFLLDFPHLSLKKFKPYVCEENMLLPWFRLHINV